MAVIKVAKNKRQTVHYEDQFNLSWRKFFLALGFTDIFQPKLKQSEVLQISDVERDNALPALKPNETLVLRDYDCEVANFYFEIAEKQQQTPSNEIKQELTNLFRIIEENWQNSSFSVKPLNSYRYKSVFIQSKENELSLRLIKENFAESSYFTKLKTQKWILVEKNKFQMNTLSNRVELKTEINLDSPSNVFIKEQVILQLYGFNVTYAVNVPLFKDRLSLSREINFKSDFNTSEFLSEKLNWCNSYAIGKTSYFFATINQMRNIYSFIGKNKNKNS